MAYKRSFGRAGQQNNPSRQVGNAGKVSARATNRPIVPSGSPSQPRAQVGQTKGRLETKKQVRSGDRSCFKCGDKTHGVFQCPQITSTTEAKELYETRTGRKVIKPVAAAASMVEASSMPTSIIPYMVMGAIELRITPDSDPQAAERLEGEGFVAGLPGPAAASSSPQSRGQGGAGEDKSQAKSTVFDTRGPAHFDECSVLGDRTRVISWTWRPTAITPNHGALGL